MYIHTYACNLTYYCIMYVHTWLVGRVAWISYFTDTSHTTYRNVYLENFKNLWFWYKSQMSYPLHFSQWKIQGLCYLAMIMKLSKKPAKQSKRTGKSQLDYWFPKTWTSYTYIRWTCGNWLHQFTVATYLLQVQLVSQIVKHK